MNIKSRTSSNNFMPQVDKTQQEINKKNVKVTGNVADENGSFNWCFSHEG